MQILAKNLKVLLWFLMTIHKHIDTDMHAQCIHHWIPLSTTQDCTTECVMSSPSSLIETTTQPTRYFGNQSRITTKSFHGNSWSRRWRSITKLKFPSKNRPEGNEMVQETHPASTCQSEIWGLILMGYSNFSVEASMFGSGFVRVCVLPTYLVRSFGYIQNKAPWYVSSIIIYQPHALDRWTSTSGGNDFSWCKVALR